MPVEKIQISRIVNTYPGVPRDRVESRKRTIESDGCIDLLPPVLSERKGDSFYLLDGADTFVAASELGYVSLWVEW